MAKKKEINWKEVTVEWTGFIVIWGISIFTLNYLLTTNEDFAKFIMENGFIESKLGGSFIEVVSEKVTYMIDGTIVDRFVMMEYFLLIRLNDTSTKYNIVHETCHGIWKLHLNDDKRQVYQNIVSNSKSFVSIYSRLNIDEDFAEHCANYILEKKGINEQRLKFMEENV